MIYKIVMDFSNLDEIIKILSNRFNLIFIGNAIYICDKKYANTTIQYIKKILKNNNIFILKIDETNLSNESTQVIQWCRDKFVQRDLKKFEEDRQDEIKNFMNVLDDFESRLQNIVENNNEEVKTT